MKDDLDAARGCFNALLIMTVFLLIMAWLSFP